MKSRRSVRFFSDRALPDGIIDVLIATAGTAPSGANKQPWTFCVVTDHEVKRQIRIAAEEEEYLSYHQRMPQDWLDDLAPLGTNWQKSFLEDAPALIVVFAQKFGFDQKGEKVSHYYVQESVGIACGLLIAAIHQAGLCTLTHTPSPMQFLHRILNRPVNERPFLLLPLGYPAAAATVPDIQRKSIHDIIVKI
jgi:nitroreductase